MSTHDVPAPPRGSAAAWLAAGPGRRPVDLAVIGVPTRAGTAGPTGAHATPAAVRRALGGLSTWASSRDADVGALAPYDRGDVDDPELGDEGEWRVRIAASSAAQRARLLVAIGGTGNTTAPVLDGVCGAEIATAGLVTLDARHDVTGGRGGGAAVRRCIDLGLPADRVVVVGAADWAEPRERTAAAADLGVRSFDRAMVGERGIRAVLADAFDLAAAAGGPVYVSLDLGACEQALVPGCAAALPGGLPAGDLLAAAYAAGADPRVRAVDLVEADASADATDGRTVRLAAVALLEVAAGLTARPNR